MAQTTTLRAQGATRASEPRLRSPRSSSASIYFISPARPAAIHSGKCLSSAASAAGAMPARAMPDGKGLLDAELFHFLVIVLAVEDVPLLRAFEDGAFLALDFLAGGDVDSFFLIKQIFEDFAGFLADGVGVLDKFDLVHLLEHVGNGPGQHVDFVAGQSHSTALYLRTSSVFTLRNISW